MQQFTSLYYAITVYLIIYMLTITIKPAFIFDKERNCLRNFGVGYQNTSVITLWLFTIMLAISCYLLLYYIDFLHGGVF